MTVYTLFVVNKIKGVNEYEDNEYIYGIYSTKENAMKVLNKIFPENMTDGMFHISEWVIDELIDLYKLN